MRLAIITVMLAAGCVYAAPLIDADGRYHAAAPTRVEAAGGVGSGPSDSWLIDNAGWRLATAQEIADKEAADAAAQAEAEAQAALPQTFETGIAVPNGDHWYQLVPDGTNVVAQTIAVQVSQSPLTPEQHDAMLAAALAARKAKVEAARSAKNNSQFNVQGLAARISALEALLGIE